MSMGQICLEDSFPPGCLAAMKGLWADDAFQRSVTRGNEYAQYDNLQ